MVLADLRQGLLPGAPGEPLRGQGLEFRGDRRQELRADALELLGRGVHAVAGAEGRDEGRAAGGRFEGLGALLRLLVEGPGGGLGAVGGGTGGLPHGASVGGPEDLRFVAAPAEETGNLARPPRGGPEIVGGSLRGARGQGGAGGEPGRRAGGEAGDEVRRGGAGIGEEGRRGGVPGEGAEAVLVEVREADPLHGLIEQEGAEVEVHPALPVEPQAVDVGQLRAEGGGGPGGGGGAGGPIDAVPVGGLPQEAPAEGEDPVRDPVHAPPLQGDGQLPLQGRLGDDGGAGGKEPGEEEEESRQSPHVPISFTERSLPMTRSSTALADSSMDFSVVSSIVHPLFRKRARLHWISSSMRSGSP